MTDIKYDSEKVDTIRGSIERLLALDLPEDNPPPDMARSLVDSYRTLLKLALGAIDWQDNALVSAFRLAQKVDSYGIVDGILVKKIGEQRWVITRPGYSIAQARFNKLGEWEIGDLSDRGYAGSVVYEGEFEAISWALKNFPR